jgi:hypothetical protein
MVEIDQVLLGLDWASNFKPVTESAPRPCGSARKYRSFPSFANLETLWTSRGLTFMTLPA